MATANTDISKTIEELALSSGAEIYGVASAAEYETNFPDKPKPSSFVEGAQSIIIFGLSFEPGTVATVLKPELAGLKRKATDDVASSNVHPVGAERYFLGEESDLLRREAQHIGYKVAKRLRHLGYTALHLPPQSSRPSSARGSMLPR